MNVYVSTGFPLGNIDFSSSDLIKESMNNVRILKFQWQMKPSQLEVDVSDLQ